MELGWVLHREEGVGSGGMFGLLNGEGVVGVNGVVEGRAQVGVVKGEGRVRPLQRIQVNLQVGVGVREGGKPHMNDRPDKDDQTI